MASPVAAVSSARPGEAGAIGTGTQRGNTIYAHVNNWPGHTPAEQRLSFYQPACAIAFGGLRTKVKSVRMLGGEKPLAFAQDDLSLRVTGLPAAAPDQPATVIAIECDGEPVMDRDYVKPSPLIVISIQTRRPHFAAATPGSPGSSLDLAELVLYCFGLHP